MRPIRGREIRLAPREALEIPDREQAAGDIPAVLENVELRRRGVPEEVSQPPRNPLLPATGPRLGEGRPIEVGCDGRPLQGSHVDTDQLDGPNAAHCHRLRLALDQAPRDQPLDSPTCCGRRNACAHGDGAVGGKPEWTRCQSAQDAGVDAGQPRDVGRDAQLPLQPVDMTREQPETSARRPTYVETKTIDRPDYPGRRCAEILRDLTG